MCTLYGWVYTFSFFEVSVLVPKQFQADRRHNSRISRQLGLDDYDYEDSFIDDTDEALQVYLYATCSQEALDVKNNHYGGEERSSGESSDDSVGQRDSPYRLRNRHNPRTTSSRNTRSSTFVRYNKLNKWCVLCKHHSVLRQKLSGFVQFKLEIPVSMIHILRYAYPNIVFVGNELCNPVTFQRRSQKNAHRWQCMSF